MFWFVNFFNNAAVISTSCFTFRSAPAWDCLQRFLCWATSGVSDNPKAHVASCVLAYCMFSAYIFQRNLYQKPTTGEHPSSPLEHTGQRSEQAAVSFRHNILFILFFMSRWMRKHALLCQVKHRQKEETAWFFTWWLNPLDASRTDLSTQTWLFGWTNTLLKLRYEPDQSQNHSKNAHLLKILFIYNQSLNNSKMCERGGGGERERDILQTKFILFGLHTKASCYELVTFSGRSNAKIRFSPKGKLHIQAAGVPRIKETYGVFRLQRYMKCTLSSICALYFFITWHWEMFFLCCISRVVC